MKIDCKKLKLAMARACMNNADLSAASGLYKPAINNVIHNAIAGKSVHPATLGKIAKGLCVDPAEIIAE